MSSVTQLRNKEARDLHCSSCVFGKPSCKMVSAVGHKIVPHFQSTFLYVAGSPLNDSNATASKQQFLW